MAKEGHGADQTDLLGFTKSHATQHMSDVTDVVVASTWQPLHSSPHAAGGGGGCQALGPRTAETASRKVSGILSA